MTRYAVFIDFSSSVEPDELTEEGLKQWVWASLEAGFNHLEADIHLFSVKEKKLRGRPSNTKLLVMRGMVGASKSGQEEGEGKWVSRIDTLKHFREGWEEDLGSVKESTLKRVLRELVMEGYLEKKYSAKHGTEYKPTEQGNKFAKAGVEHWLETL